MRKGAFEGEVSSKGVSWDVTAVSPFKNRQEAELGQLGVRASGGTQERGILN